MLERELMAALREALVEGTVTSGVIVAVWRNNAPTTQGRRDGPTLYLTKLFDRRNGWASSRDENGQHVERQLVETTVQITALADKETLAASDYAQVAADVLQSDEGRARLAAAGLRPLRVTEIRNPYFTNDQNHFEASPSFDVVLGHERVRTYVVPDATPEPRLVGVR